MRKSVSGILIMLLLIGMFTLVFNIRSVSAQGEDIFINVDGSITPSSAPISTVDNVTYILTGNMTYPTFNGISVERSNIVIDGNGYTLQGNQSAYGILWANSVNNVTIKNTNIEGFFYGVEIYDSSDNTVCDCSITNNGEGIELAFSSSNKLNGNEVANNVYDGIVLGASDSSLVGNNIVNNEGYGILLAGSDNGVVGNNIANNLYGIYFSTGANNVLYHNDFVRNHFQVSTWYPPQNTWDKGYPSGGNYWSDYNGTDLYSGPYQNVTGSDGIGDTPYVIDFLDIDHYPLMNPYNASSLFISISPGSATLDVGQSQMFTSIATGGTSSYTYQWCLNGTAVPDAIFSSWTFTQTSPGSYTVYLNVTDGAGVIATSNTASTQTALYNITFGQVGVGSDYTGTVVAIDGTNYSENDLPVSFLWDDDSTHTFAYQSPLVAEVNAEQYVWTGTSGLSSLQSGSINVTTDGSIIGNYKTQYNVAFDTTGVGSDFTGPIVVIDGSSYNASALPTSFWYDKGATHSFAYQSALVASTTTYYWNSTTGLSALQSGLINVTGPGSITGNYIFHEVIVTNITASNAWAYRGWTTTVNVTVSNKGDFSENAWLTLYYNITADKSINTYPVYLGAGQNYTLTFTWNTNGVPCLNYTLTAVATIPTGSNTLSDGNISVRLMGDVNGDGRVDLRDIALVARAFGSTPGSPNWNSYADINGDGKVDMKDIASVIRNFGQHYA